MRGGSGLPIFLPIIPEMVNQNHVFARIAKDKKK